MDVFTQAVWSVITGSAAGYGIAFVSAHAAKDGKNGNIPTLDIDSVEGASIYIRNLHSFTGGQDAYSLTYLTSQDRQNALSQARAILLPHTISGLLQSPCKETVTGSQRLFVVWTCQFVTYQAPSFSGVRVIHAQVIGKIVLLDIVYLPRPQRIETK